VYEVLVALNRNAKKDEFGGGDSFSDMPTGDIEPLYELDSRSQHGCKPVGEEDIGGLIASTAGDLAALSLL
jgi:hypothetical protein